MAFCPNLDRLTVGVDLGDQWSRYCILDLEGETLSEGQLRTTQPEVAEFFQAVTPSRVVNEVGTHSAWVQELIAKYGHEALVANPRLMEGSKRRKRKSDRIEANELARLGRVDPKSLYLLRHRSTEVRQDLVMLRASEALIATRTEMINTTRGLVKSELRAKGNRGASGGRLVKHARYYWLLLAESHLTRLLFGSMLRRIAVLSVFGGIAEAVARKSIQSQEGTEGCLTRPDQMPLGDSLATRVGAHGTLFRALGLAKRKESCAGSA